MAPHRSVLPFFSFPGMAERVKYPPEKFFDQFQRRKLRCVRLLLNRSVYKNSDR